MRLATLNIIVLAALMSASLLLPFPLLPRSLPGIPARVQRWLGISAIAALGAVSMRFFVLHPLLTVNLFGQV